jgi:endonuclease G
MKHKKIHLFLLYVIMPFWFYSQETNPVIDSIREEIINLEAQKIKLLTELSDIKLSIFTKDLKKFGLPKIDNNEDLVEHSAFILLYNEEHEQADWVAHIISADIAGSGYSRTNDFRIDTKIKTGSAVEADYFLKYLQEDSTYKYDGFGYDRGHLAPSADFRWSLTAMSESYYYSNMSPQLPEFNREIWAELESNIREYVQEKNERVFVVTGPIYNEEVRKLERSVNNLSIPDAFFKVLIDMEGDTLAGIGFIVPHEECEYPPMSYAVSINEVEKRTGFDFFHALDDELENKLEADTNYRYWQAGMRKVNVRPIHRNRLPKNSVNTVMARSHYDSKAKVCGTVVEVHETKSGHIFINFDYDFPEQLFWATIWKDNIINFSYDPKEYLLNQKICVKGIVKKKYGKPSMSIYNEKTITFYEDEMSGKKN